MRLSSTFFALLSSTALLSAAFPTAEYASLAGLSQREIEEILPRLSSNLPGKPPGPIKFNGTKLVNDASHPWKPLRKGDIRGPCPGLNTLASHGYLPRDGIATPAQIVTACQEGFNMEHATAVFVTYAAMLVDGNLVTDLLSIGGKSKKTGPDPPKPAIVGGLETHAVFEGDSSMTRADDFFGDNGSFNQDLWDQFVDYSNRFGGGYYNWTVAAELRNQRIKQSIANNPEFSFVSPRYFTAFAESTFPINFFVDGRSGEQKLDMVSALSFFRDSKFPPDFHRASKPTGPEGIDKVFTPYPIQPGANAGKVDSYTLDPTSANFETFCQLYTDFVTKTVGSLYPNPQGILRRNLAINLRYFYSGLGSPDCPEIFPYGQV